MSTLIRDSSGIALVFAHKTRDAATAQKNLAFGGANRLFGCVAILSAKTRDIPLLSRKSVDMMS